ncbi:tyrosine-type recombinase/integrase [Paraburkholderia terricola]|nr:tyrosine-type recombinase/integrase [Paraburkholderia terricola]
MARATVFLARCPRATNQHLRKEVKTRILDPRSSPESGAFRWRHYAENTRLLYGERQHAGADLDIVRNAVRYAAKRCGLEQRVRGTHVFRHTIACRMAQSGAPFKQIADLLRHRDLDTTTIYAKVDLPSLRRVALPWPGRRS